MNVLLPNETSFFLIGDEKNDERIYLRQNFNGNYLIDFKLTTQF